MRLAAWFFNGVAIVSALLVGMVHAQDNDTLANAPDYSQDKFPPYPPLTNSDGSNITIGNLQGVRLFGWKGCDSNGSKAIAEAFDDFYKLAKPLSKGIDWASEIAEDFWGRDKGENRVPDERRAQIEQIFIAQQQMHTIKWHDPPPNGTSLWIEVRCSDDAGQGDPYNHCLDKNSSNGQCARGGSPTHDHDNRLQAYAESTTFRTELPYSRITFCNQFFQMKSLTDAMNTTSKQSESEKKRLEVWDNRARVFLHEISHLDHFMNAPGSSPLVDDLKFNWTQGEQEVSDWGYGPFFSKMLRNYAVGDVVAFYPQRNADSYAWFAVGSYVKQVTGTYPRYPRPVNWPIQKPLNSNDGDVEAVGVEPIEPADPSPRDPLDEATDWTPNYPNGFSNPGCADGIIESDTASMSDSTPDAWDTETYLLTLGHTCHNVSGPFWVTSRDVAMGNVQDFCGQSEQIKRYNIGSVDELELHAHKYDDETKTPLDAPDCIKTFQDSLIDGCDYDPVNNPHNYKFGGTLGTDDKWFYQMAPLNEKKNEVSCDGTGWLIFDSFKMMGNNLPDALFGANGENLEREVKRCHDVSFWFFNWTPNEKYQWEAGGNILVGRRDCLGDALMRAGGTTRDKCHGTSVPGNF